MTPPKRSSRWRAQATPVQAAHLISCPQRRSCPTCQTGCQCTKDGRKSSVTGGTARRNSTCISPSRTGRGNTSMGATAPTNPSGTSDATSRRNFSIGECPSSFLSRHSDSHIPTLRYGGDEAAFTAAYDVTTVTALLESVKAARTERGEIESRPKKSKTARNAQGEIETGPSKKSTARNARGEIESRPRRNRRRLTFHRRRIFFIRVLLQHT